MRIVLLRPVLPELIAIKPVQAVPGAEPHHAGMVLEYRIDGTITQPVVIIQVVVFPFLSIESQAEQDKDTTY